MVGTVPIPRLFLHTKKGLDAIDIEEPSSIPIPPGFLKDLRPERGMEKVCRGKVFQNRIPLPGRDALHRIVLHREIRALIVGI
jgi:hypothetical protein